MSLTLAHIWRHPIKSHGREQLTSVELSAGNAMPFDRRWAITHTLSKHDAADPKWISCGNFVRGAKVGALTAIDCVFDEASGLITLNYFDQTVTADPNSKDGAEDILAFARQISNETWLPKALVELENHGFTDTDYPSISILNLASLRELSARGGHEFTMERFRGNLWIEGAMPWAETDWVGQRFQIDEAVLEVIEPIGRCSMTTHNPATGTKDFDTLKLLREEFNHQNFGVYARVISSGRIDIGAEIKAA